MFQARPRNDLKYLGFPVLGQILLLHTVYRIALTRQGGKPTRLTCRDPATEGLPKPARSVKLRTAIRSRAQALNEVSKRWLRPGEIVTSMVDAVKAHPCSIHPPSEIS